MKNSNNHIIIIGAGIAGLSAASYLVRNGYKVTVVEQHSQPGGLCTSWKRKGYIVDYCVHWLMGTKEGTDFHRIWEELGAFTNADGSKVPIVNFDDFTTVWLSNGEKVCLYSDLEKLRHELLRIAPEDVKEIDRFCISLKKLGSANMAAITEEQTLLKSLGSMVRNASGFVTLMKQLIPMETFAERFKNPQLKELFLTEIPADWSVVSLTLGLAQQPFRSAGYTIGGSLNLAKNIERSAIERGAEILYGTAVEKILVEDNKAKGVVLANGRTIESNYVISAADGCQTLYKMLEGKYLPASVKKAYDTYPLFPSTVMVALGVNRDCTDLPHGFSPYFSNAIEFPDGTAHNRFAVNVYSYDPTLSPKGNTLITVLINTWEGETWESLFQNDKKKYELEKTRIAQEVIDRLDMLVGDISGNIEMVDISTPHSVIRYTGNWQGSFEGFAPTKATLSKTLPKTLEGLDNFAMIGQWTTPGGGLPTAAKDGRDIAIRLCKEDGKKFNPTL
ncbi:phytoene desaturase family protein [Pleomorphochaeta sp. DL1XJH-081]|uniref:phytoene desaturase family protein n=1 Tax=Pleomorphochaeta sp. DL1XJH-081 TaxID=3409690 RepID=UPI003BB49398